MTRGWDILVPGCGGISMLSREATSAARLLREVWPISNHADGGRFPYGEGRY